MSFANRLYTLRTKAGYTQAQLSKILDVSASTIGMYEQGRRLPDFKMLIKLRSVFNVSSDYLLGCDNLVCIEIKDIILETKNKMLATEYVTYEGSPITETDIEGFADAMFIVSSIIFKKQKKSYK